jgi:hypothetical protein
MADSEDDLLRSTQFRVIFTNTSATPTSSLPWKEADIRWIADKPRSTPPPTQQTKTCKAARGTRQVRFDQVSTHAGNDTARVKFATKEVKIANFRIPDLCLAIATLHQPPIDECARYLLDDLQRKHGIYPCSIMTCQNKQQTWSAYTLRQILTKQAGFGRPLMQRDTYKVAVDLASSVLQLYETPWLTNDWSDADVYFVHRPGAPLATVYQHPFILRKFASSTANQGFVDQPPIRRVIRNQTLFTLGIVLIELLYGVSIEALQTSRDLDCEGTPGVVWCTAERLIEEEIADHGGQLYADAVRRCIRCDFNHNNASLSEQAFQRAVYDGVVTPLERTLRHFNGED